MELLFQILLSSLYDQTVETFVHQLGCQNSIQEMLTLVATTETKIWHTGSSNA